MSLNEVVGWETILTAFKFPTTTCPLAKNTLWSPGKLLLLKSKPAPSESREVGQISRLSFPMLSFLFPVNCSTTCFQANYVRTFGMMVNETLMEDFVLQHIVFDLSLTASQWSRLIKNTHTANKKNTGIQELTYFHKTKNWRKLGFITPVLLISKCLSPQQMFRWQVLE